MKRFGYLTHANNLAAVDGVVISSSSELTAYPAANAVLMPISRPWRPESLTSEWIEFDLGSAQAIDTVALINSNHSSGASIVHTAGASPAPAGNATFFDASTEFNVIVRPSLTFRYHRIAITDTGNTDSILSMGYIMLGNLSSPTDFTFAYDWRFVDVFENMVTRSEFGVEHFYEMYERSRLQLAFLNRSASQMGTLRTLFRSVKKNLTPLMLIPDMENLDDVFFGRFVNDLERSMDVQQSAILEFWSDSRGKIIGA